MPTIRPARLDDAAAIAALAGQLGYPADVETTRRRLETLLDDADHAVLVVEDGAGPDDACEIAGWLQVATAPRLYGTPLVEIVGLVIDERRRGRGLGRALVERAAAWAEARGTARLRVRSNLAREGSHRFYRRLGFREVKSQAVYERDVIRAG